MDRHIIRLKDQPELSDRCRAVVSTKKMGHPVCKPIYGKYATSLAATILFPRIGIRLEQDRIISGLGVIENDFHNRKDLTPKRHVPSFTRRRPSYRVIAALWLARVFRRN